MFLKRVICWELAVESSIYAETELSHLFNFHPDPFHCLGDIYLQWLQCLFYFSNALQIHPPNSVSPEKIDSEVDLLCLEA